MNVPTAELNLRKYARCEWKCFYTCVRAILAVALLSEARVKILQRTAGRLRNWNGYSPSAFEYSQTAKLGTMIENSSNGQSLGL